ncbi:hypothetical protein TSAR_014862 [Trichomalopsis sarcophagae]|uniref:Uncharacterized protein n=1 Tax=Trichomalopsis sarcophagae TaxID=543379 RepID=A0A232F0W7_9HYME|nr:hypothetical protein TSAR_014862 [Trichomalopsis sarcophagae]
MWSKSISRCGPESILKSAMQKTRRSSENEISSRRRFGTAAAPEREKEGEYILGEDDWRRRVTEQLPNSQLDSCPRPQWEFRPTDRAKTIIADGLFPRVQRDATSKNIDKVERDATSKNIDKRLNYNKLHI